MRDAYISGYVQKDIHRNDKTTLFQIAVYKGKDQSGKTEYEYLSVKVFDGNFQVDEGDYVIAKTQIDRFKYNDNWYVHFVCFANDIVVKKAEPKEEQGGPENFHDDSIPF